ncbi:Helicase-associated domain [Dillenia turbinata]|uniref:RNA helicase n=1 Tax=Dillenia turbinata TaxID=194707 RepID=A0AAN8ZB15_9MAGN
MDVSVECKVRPEGMKGRDTHLFVLHHWHPAEKVTGRWKLERYLACCPKRSPSSLTRVVADFDECSFRCGPVHIILWSIIPYGSHLLPFGRVQGFIYPVRTHFLENVLEMTGYRLTPYGQIDDYGQEKMWKMNKQALRKRKSQLASLDALRSTDLKDYSIQTCESLSCWNPDCMGFNLIEYLLCHICENEKPGAVLVLTGWDDIRDPYRVLLLACHGAMASADQRLIFNEPDDGVRKIVLATNIAEAGITINDVVFVIDCGKAKESSDDALNNNPCYFLPGFLKSLHSKCVYNAFANYRLPEILRTPLQSLYLQIKSLKLGSISEFLSRVLQSPELLAIMIPLITYQFSIMSDLPHVFPLFTMLLITGALDENENLTDLGCHLTMLPMEPNLGKMLILGAIFNWLDPISTVISGLRVRDPFLTPLEKKDASVFLVEAMKAQFSCDYSHHLALVRAYVGWRDAERYFTRYEYCGKNFLSAQSMKAILMMTIYSEQLFVMVSILEFALWCAFGALSDYVSFLCGAYGRIRQGIKPSKISSVMAALPPSFSSTESGPGVDNSKIQLQRLLTRTGYAAWMYKTKQLKNNQFWAL